MRRHILDHLPVSDLVAEIYAVLAPAASFNHQVHRSTVASRAFPIAGPSFGTLFRRGDVGAVSRPRATEDLHIHTVVPEHTTALTVLCTACIVQWFSQYVLVWATLIIIIIMIIIIIQTQTLQTNIYKAPSVNTKS